MKLLNMSTLDAHEMIMVIAPVEFKNRVSTFKMMTLNKPSGFKLSQNSINCGQANFFLLAKKTPVYVLCGQVPFMGALLLQNLKDLYSW